MKTQLLVSTLLLATAMDSSAGWWRTEQNPILYADFGTYTFTNPAENTVGTTFEQFVSVDINGQLFNTHCNNGTHLNGSRIPVYVTSDYVNGPPITIAGKNYTTVNDYLQASVAYTFNGGRFPVPSVNSQFAMTSDECNVTWAHSGNTVFSISVRIAKPFVGFSYIDIPVADFYTGDNAAPFGSGKANGANQRLHLRGRVVVPQSCNINSDVEAVIDFGNISSNSFQAAGIGNQINNLPKANMPLSIRCNGHIPTNAPLTLRVQADNVGGPGNTIIMSNNPDIGFKMSDANDNLLIPNDINSKVNFINTNPANIVLKAWPVSATGNQPTPGPFQARGYLRIDFD
ncbi:fimbrial protein [Acinetobacter guillouiae]|uniref:Fimbrial protein n=1 Tax=Acinetobacter guillouiae TaxID=106649 RepID=A0A8X8GC44_ACIGI|nr:fimbrial protein [Acinetobacter guillouiae]MCF0263618.1 fimbrial protein [Acinetobacter guillouiae]